MQRYLITGVSGFVAHHFLEFLARQTEPCEVLGLDVNPWTGGQGNYPFRFETQVADLLDASTVNATVMGFRPTRVLHLASFSSVGASWKAPTESFANNTNIFLNILEALRTNAMDARVLSVGSSEEYGQVSARDLPLTEELALRPGSPYGVARVAQEQLSKVYAEGYGMQIIMTRSFNHIGPGQRDQFVVPSFVKQVVRARRAGQSSCTIRGGNTAVVRDFLDVRDVVVAYHLLLDRGRAGVVYNVCSGTGRSLNSLLADLGHLTGLRVVVETDPDLVRPNELMEIVGSAKRISGELGWAPMVDFQTSLKNLVDYWDGRLAEEERNLHGT